MARRYELNVNQPSLFGEQSANPYDIVKASEVAFRPITKNGRKPTYSQVAQRLNELKQNGVPIDYVPKTLPAARKLLERVVIQIKDRIGRKTVNLMEKIGDSNISEEENVYDGVSPETPYGINPAISREQTAREALARKGYRDMTYRGNKRRK
jgi:hypothetical protein